MKFLHNGQEKITQRRRDAKITQRKSKEKLCVSLYSYLIFFKGVQTMLCGFASLREILFYLFLACSGWGVTKKNAIAEVKQLLVKMGNNYSHSISVSYLNVISLPKTLPPIPKHFSLPPCHEFSPSRFPSGNDVFSLCHLFQIIHYFSH